MRQILLAIAILAACHQAPSVLTAPDGTPYVQDCPPPLEDVACYEYVTSHPTS